MILVSAAVYVISCLLLQALSRYREFAADRGSAILTGRPSALISALMKIDGGMARIPQRDLRAASSELAAFYIFPPKAKQRSTNLFSTHPPLRRGSSRCSGSRPSSRARALTAPRGLPRRPDGRRKLAQPAPDRLFAMSTAYVTMETSLALTSRGTAAIVFQPLATADFESIVHDMEEVVRATAPDSGTTVSSSDDTYGFRWLVLRGSDFDDLVVGINAVSSALEAGGYGERVLCAVFAFEDAPQAPGLLDLQLQARRVLPVRARRRRQQRDNERELVLKAQIGTELPVEQELERWFPLWGIADLSWWLSPQGSEFCRRWSAAISSLAAANFLTPAGMSRSATLTRRRRRASGPRPRALSLRRRPLQSASRSRRRGPRRGLDHAERWRSAHLCTTTITNS